MNYIISNSSITVLINNKPMVVDNTHPNYSKVMDIVATRANEEGIEEVVKKLVDIPAALEEFGEGKIKVSNGTIYYNDKELKTPLAIRTMELLSRGFDIGPLVRFMNNLYKNPSKRAVDELYGFLEACNLPITEDGGFLAYKKVRKDYKDVYSGTIDNSIGKIPEMPRNEVDEDSNRTCSQGLHVASYSYMKHYSGDRIVICKIMPADVVAIPNDYNNSKMRVCRYEVVGEVGLENEELPKNVIKDEEISNLNNSFNNYEDYAETFKYYHENKSNKINLKDWVDGESFEYFENLLQYGDKYPQATRYILATSSQNSVWRDELIIKLDLDIKILPEYSDLYIMDEDDVKDLVEVWVKNTSFNNIGAYLEDNINEYEWSYDFFFSIYENKFDESRKNTLINEMLADLGIE